MSSTTLSQRHTTGTSRARLRDLPRVHPMGRLHARRPALDAEARRDRRAAGIGADRGALDSGRAARRCSSWARCSRSSPSPSSRSPPIRQPFRSWTATPGRSPPRLLATIAFGSLLVTPFTEQYARESVPRQLWSSPQFKQINRQLTTMWGVVFAAMVPAHVIAGALDTHRANLIFNWAIPIALVIWAAKRTARVSDSAEARPTPGTNK